MFSFKGCHFTEDLILMAVVRGKLAYSLNYRNIEELLDERGTKDEKRRRYPGLKIDLFVSSLIDDMNGKPA